MKFYSFDLHILFLLEPKTVYLEALLHCIFEKNILQNFVKKILVL